MCYAAESDLFPLLFFQGKLTVWKLKTECQIKWDWIQSINRTSWGRKANTTSSPCSILYARLSPDHGYYYYVPLRCIWAVFHFKTRGYCLEREESSNNFMGRNKKTLWEYIAVVCFFLWRCGKYYDKISLLNRRSSSDLCNGPVPKDWNVWI